MVQVNLLDLDFHRKLKLMENSFLELILVSRIFLSVLKIRTKVLPKCLPIMSPFC